MQFDGEIRLSFVRCGNRTVAHDLYRRGNSRISANVGGEGEVPYYFLISTGGGFVEGERYRQELLLAEKTHAILTTQAPNYIYKCEHGHITTQQVVIHAETGSFLEYYVDETIPYASARFRQMTEVYLGSGARMIMTDGMTAGWAPDGTPFQYRDIGIQTRVFRKRKLF
jgi:urease accessory protein